MVREQHNDEAKAAFSRDFFKLRKSAGVIYADKQVKDLSGRIMFKYCSPEAIQDALEPLLIQNGFTTLFGQEINDALTTINLTLIHEMGHQETRHYSIRSISPNKSMDGAKCDTGSATMALRHLQIKMFGLKTRIRAEDDARMEGEPITKEQAESLAHRVAMTNSDKVRFLAVAGAATFAEIPSAKYAMLSDMLAKKEQSK